MKIHNLLIAAGFICAIATSTAPAFDQAHYQSVKQGQGDCPWCDLSGADLANLKLRPHGRRADKGRSERR
jgi:hypothetical protein